MHIKQNPNVSMRAPLPRRLFGQKDNKLQVNLIDLQYSTVIIDSFFQNVVMKCYDFYRPD